MLINKLINKYVKQGHNYRNAQNLAAEEIVLTKIASSHLADKVTLKGGIVMYNLTKSDRRVTQDIDFDLLRYSIDNLSIRKFVEKLDSINDGISSTIIGNLDKLHQEDYQGVRVHLLLEDQEQTKLKIKLDIGVHTYSAIEQDKIAFFFDSDRKSINIKVNPCEQIFCEKLLSLSRLGPLSTRYKDIYDLYFLIVNNMLEIIKVRQILDLFFLSSSRKPDSIFELSESISSTLDDRHFSIEAGKPASKWIDVDYLTAKKTILDFIAKI